MTPLFRPSEYVALGIVWGAVALILVIIYFYKKLAKAPGELWAEAFVPLPDGRRIPVDMEWPMQIKCSDINGGIGAWNVVLSNQELQRIEHSKPLKWHEIPSDRDPMLAMG